MTKQLLEQIQAAEAAALQVAQLEQVKAQADQLPLLRKQLAAQRWVAQAEPAAELAEQQAAAILAEVTPAVVQWREKLQALYADIHTHIEALPALQAEIGTAERYVRTAASYRQGIEQRTGGGVEVGADVPLDLGVNGFAEIWRRVGGYDVDLQILPHFPADQRLRVEKLIAWALKQPLVFYHPSRMGR